jgi:hypothetical protein
MASGTGDQKKIVESGCCKKLPFEFPKDEAFPEGPEPKAFAHIFMRNSKKLKKVFDCLVELSILFLYRRKESPPNDN